MSAERDSLAAFTAGVDPARVDSLWTEHMADPDTGESPAEILDRHLFGVLIEQEPSARLNRWLDLRLSGPGANEGRLDIGIAHEVLHAFTQEVAGAAEVNSVREGVSLELAGVSKGSAVLHLVPAESSGPQIPEGQFAVAVDPVDEIISTITDLHHTAEARGDLRRFAEHESLVRGLRSLASTLDTHDLDLEMGWRSSTGLHRKSRLDRPTRQYLKELWEVSYVERQISVSGYVVRLDLAGHFDIKVSSARNSKRYEIQVDGENALMDLHLELGQTLNAWVFERKRINHLGIEQNPTHHFIRMNSDQLSL